MKPTIIFVENHTMKKTLFALLVCMAPFCVIAQLPSYLPTDGLVGWWPFNGNANDESGNGNHGVVNGATLTTNRNGDANRAYIFDGNSSIIVPHSNTLHIGNEMTLSVWFKQLNMGNTINYILQKGSAGGCLNTGYYCGIDYLFGSLPNGAKGLNYGQNNYCSGIGSDTLISDFSWHSMIIIYAPPQGNKIYIDGLLINPNFSYCNTCVISNSNNPLIIGAFSNAGNITNPQNWNGLLDDIAIYNRALNPEEITALYTATPTNGGGGNNNASANVPQGISYQAVARNPQGLPLSNTALQVKFTLLSDSLTGTTEYSELHSLTTNDLGLFTTAFGTGTPLSGTFANINWAGGNKFVKIEADQGSGFIEMGTQQMLSVPFSMRSQTSAAIQNNGLPVFANNAAALAGGLQAGQIYRTAAGVLMVVY